MSDHGKILFGHPTYRLGEEFARRFDTPFVEVRCAEDFAREIVDAEVCIVSKFWKNDYLPIARNLKFIQSISAGMEMFDLADVKTRGIRIATAQGANENAVAEHAIALMLSLSRHLHLCRDRQHQKHWRKMIDVPEEREQEMTGRHVLIIGMGRIGSILANLCKAFGMEVSGLRRSPLKPGEPVTRMFRPDQLNEALSQADYVVLNCPLTPETRNLIGPDQINAMKKSAYLINVARGAVVDEAALTEAVLSRRIRGAALDTFQGEPLSPDSPLWAAENAIVTPHSAGETSLREKRTIDIVGQNIQRYLKGEPLENEIV